MLCDIVSRWPRRQVAEAKDVHVVRYLPEQTLLSRVQLCFERCPLAGRAVVDHRRSERMPLKFVGERWNLIKRRPGEVALLGFLLALSSGCVPIWRRWVHQRTRLPLQSLPPSFHCV